MGGWVGRRVGEVGRRRGQRVGRRLEVFGRCWSCFGLWNPDFEVEYENAAFAPQVRSAQFKVLQAEQRATAAR